MADEPTRVDNILNSLKNHWLLAWVIVSGIVLIAIAQFRTAVSELFPRSLVPKPPSAVSSAAKDSGEDCWYFLVPALRLETVDPPHYRSTRPQPLPRPQVAGEAKDITVELGRDSVKTSADLLTLPAVVVAKAFDPKQYTLRVWGTFHWETEDVSPMYWAGTVTLDETKRYFEIEPFGLPIPASILVGTEPWGSYTKGLDGSIRTRALGSRDDWIRRVTAARAHIPKCDAVKPGLQWSQ